MATSGQLPLRGKAVVITGGSAGIGFAAAAALARLGSSVLLVGRSAQRVADAAIKLQLLPGTPTVCGLALDVTREDHMGAMAKAAIERFGRVDILVAAAGVLRANGGAIRTLVDTPLSEWNEIIDINLTGTYLSNRAVLPTMIGQRSGLIINVASTSGRKGYAFDAAYCASKFGVIGMTEALSAEVQHYGVRAMVVLPGAIDTPMWDQNGPIPRPQDVLDVDRVGDLMGFLATLPADTEYIEPVIEPFRVHERPAWRQGGRIQGQ